MMCSDLVKLHIARVSRHQITDDSPSCCGRPNHGFCVFCRDNCAGRDSLRCRCIHQGRNGGAVVATGTGQGCEGNNGATAEEASPADDATSAALENGNVKGMMTGQIRPCN